MAILLIHFVPIILLSFFVVRKLSKLQNSQWPFIAFYLLLLILVYRPFVIAAWMISPLWIISLSAICFLLAKRRKRDDSMVYSFTKLFLLIFPVWLIFVVLIFSLLTATNCDRLADVRGLDPIFSYCDPGKETQAEKYTRDLYHCRNSFYNSSRNLIHIVFGAETNPDIHTMPAIDPDTGKVASSVRTYTVFRAYCDPALKICLHLVSPKFSIRFWDDAKDKTISTINFGEDRPRFLSPDWDRPLVYVATDDTWVGIVDMVKRKVLKRIEFPASSLLTVDNTKKYVLVTANLFFHNDLMYYDKKSGKTGMIKVGAQTFWKNFGFLFHVAADPAGERAFVAAPFECSVYQVDMLKKKTVNKINLPIGIRDLAYDTKRNELYAANFVNGYVYRLTTKNNRLAIKDRFYVGRRLRYFVYQPDKDVFLAASSNGFHIYRPDAAKRRGTGD